MSLPPEIIDSVTAESEEFDPVFSYKEGGRVRHVHIPGGNVRSALSQSRAIEVRAKIAVGATSAQIAEMIRKWSDKK
ncbi:MAG: hypothetical protein JGK26_32570 [Microcoleus sp. PH2017_27_LUM_O_A]|uniref:hypothetical protein n=1 Tax=Microcoleus sp. PH2017_27_LUM_O_A TaxID=2798837 RepID=UPI001E12CBDC|nr:hypothetical protein [Microcoleus sp. PH2017_27_LUM_O_A]MCC3563729.1 hypothetical protein [Microcoleus sp. PH2017_27_LUM_O_A]